MTNDKFAKSDERLLDLGACKAIVFRAVRENITDGYFIKLFGGLVGSYAEEFFTKDGQIFHRVQSARAEDTTLLKSIDRDVFKDEHRQVLARQALALWVDETKCRPNSLVSFNPVAVKLRQPFVNAPEHETWGTVTCDECDEQFGIGYNRVYGNRIEEARYVAYFEKLLAEE